MTRRIPIHEQAADLAAVGADLIRDQGSRPKGDVTWLWVASVLTFLVRVVKLLTEVSRTTLDNAPRGHR